MATGYRHFIADFWGFLNLPRTSANREMVPHRGQSWALRSLGNFAVSRLRLVGSGLADCGDGSQEAFHCSTDRGVRN